MKQLLLLDKDGYLIIGEDIFIQEEYDEEGKVMPIDIPVGYIDNPLPTNERGEQLGFYRPRWTGTEWIEDATQEEIDELNKPVDVPLTDTEILGQQMTERELEAMVQGQKITDLELRMITFEMGASS